MKGMEMWQTFATPPKDLTRPTFQVQSASQNINPHTEEKEEEKKKS
jgi:hypothetical protein